jgi:hypothetical protein
MISLGQTNSIVSCPGLTTHSELNAEQQQEAQIFPTTIRFAMGIENPMDLIDHLVNAATLSIDQAIPGFSAQFMSREDAVEMARKTYTQMHQRYAQAVL